jgi:predicted house-cleaning noncanonical NTP pyrophosphatase (MazG superfamily)
MALPTDGKLVRDLIPQIILDSGKVPVTCSVSGDDLLLALKQKAQEESHEFATASPETVLEEVADVLEVLRSFVIHFGSSWEFVLELANAKRDQRGGFDEGIWLLSTK